MVTAKQGKVVNVLLIKIERKEGQMKPEILKTKGKRACCGDAGEKSKRRR